MGGHRHSHHLPKSFWSNSSHGQTSFCDAGVHCRGTTLIPVCPVPWKCHEHGFHHSSFPTELLGAFLPTCPKPWVTHRSFLLQQNHSSPGELHPGSCRCGWAAGKSGWFRSLARKTAGGCIPPGTALSHPAGNFPPVGFPSESEDKKKGGKKPLESP